MKMPHYAKNTGIYFVIEKIYAKSGAPSLFNTIGSATVQVVRSVYEVIQLQDIYLDGEKVDYDYITLWQRIKVLWGYEIVAKNTAEIQNSLVFCGVENFITPLPNLNDNILGDKTTKLLSDSYHLVVAPLGFGLDPIPDIKLYGGADVIFISENGGLDAPTAMAKYNKKTRELVMITSAKELKSLMLHI